MLEAVVNRLVQMGHEVTVICAAGGYAGCGGRRADGSGQRADGGEQAAANCQRPIDPPPTANGPQPTVVRLRASRFGRRTFVGKLADYVSFYLGAAWKLLMLHPRPDRIIALTTPPYLSLLARLVSKLRGADHAHWVMDLYPDVMVAHGMLADGGWKHRLLAAFARWGFGGGRCASILTLGPDMAERASVGSGRRPEAGQRLAERDSSCPETPQPTPDRQSPTVSWVPLWGSGEGGAVGRGRLAEGGGSVAGPVVASGAGGESEVDQLAVGGGRLAENELPDVPNQNPKSKIQNPKSALRAKRGWRDDERVVMYSGNMGLGHRFGEFLEAARRLGVRSGQLAAGADRGKEPMPGAQARQPTANRQPVRFVFYGGGKRRGEIAAFMREHPNCAVELHDYAPAEELAEHLLSADVHLASLDAAWTGTMVPSKLQGIFAVGRPVIFVGSPESSIGRWVTESGGGWVVEPDDVEGLLAALNEAGDPEVCMARGNAAVGFAKSHFDKKTNATRVAEIFTR